MQTVSDQSDAQACPACATSTPPTARFCLACGTALSASGNVEPVPAIAVNEEPLPAQAPAIQSGASTPPTTPLSQDRLYETQPNTGRLDLLEAIRFPFRQTNWLSKLWWLSLLAYIPPFNFIILRGWRLDITRRIARENPDALPDLNDIGRFFAEGFLLWMMTGIYLFPQVILITILGFGPLETALTIIGWLFATLFTDNETVPFMIMLSQIGIASLMGTIIPIIYWILTYPLYRIGMVRYATSGKLSDFFDVFRNFWLMTRHYIAIMTIFFFELATWTLFGIVSGLVSATAIGVFLVPALILPSFYWTNGYIFGSFALMLKRSQQK
jgi:hypothetical protein